MTTKLITAESLQKQLAMLKRKVDKLQSRGEGRLIKTASHLFMGGVMMMFFVGVALGVYVTVCHGEPVGTTMDYIMQLARIVGLGYFVKAFGENIAKMVLSSLCGNRFTESNNKGEAGNSG